MATDMPNPTVTGDSLVDLGWDPGWATAFLPYDAAGLVPARVVAAHRDAWVVAQPGDAADTTATVSGRFRHEAFGAGDFPAVGDWVAVAAPRTDGSPTVVQAVLPRRTAFMRSAGEERLAGNLAAEQVLAANVDVAFVVAGMDGDFNLRRIERYLAVAWSGGATPVIVLNKADVAADVDGLRVAATAVAPGVEVHAISALNGDGVEPLRDAHLARGRTAVVLGSSGVGKSTLVNALAGEARQRTASVREDDSRGRHTTTHRALIALPSGGCLIDTPGMRERKLTGDEELGQAGFADIETLALQCRFGDCAHGNEPGCAVRAALESGDLDAARWANFLKMRDELSATNDTLEAQLKRKGQARVANKALNKRLMEKYRVR